MPEQDATLRKIAWKEVFPWLSLFRVFTVSLTGQVLLLAFLGTMLVPFGWRCSEFLFVSKERDKDPNGGDHNEFFIAKVEYLRAWPWQRYKLGGERAVQGAMAQVARGNPPATNSWSAWIGNSWLNDVVKPVGMPIGEAMSPQAFFRHRAYFVFGSLWLLAVWGLIGGMICRIAVVRLAQEERLTLAENFEFTRRRWHSHSGAPLFPLGGIILVTLMIALGSVLLRTGTWWGVPFGTPH